MKYYIIAGEASGDLHGSNLIKALKKNNPDASFRCWGGDLMKSQCNDLVMHYQDFSYMGFLEVILNINKILSYISFCKNDIEKFKPDLIIYIDYPGFNMRIAKWAKSKNYINHFYISPKVWVWKEKRVEQIKKVIDKMYVILPFEEDFYKKKHNYKVDFVGHPLLDAIESENTFNKNDFLLVNNLSEKPIIALLPGSRNQEINKLLPVMLEAVSNLTGYQLVIAGAPSKNVEYYEKIIQSSDSNTNNIKVISNQTYNILRVSTAAIVTSGTATLETALFNVPQVVCYKTSWISYLIGRLLIRNLKYISLVNIIQDKEVVKELIQNDCNKTNLVLELEKILDQKNRSSMLAEYKILHNKLGGKGASKKTADLINKYMEN
ncbi:MAG: Lipid-A-disaccharide synthase [Flavobacteriaceae bacterium]|nr:MAG: Lipid-A-disaccharide synthase [Flavobacteriaceae bacterium]